MRHLAPELTRRLLQLLDGRESELVALLHAASRQAAESAGQPHEVQDFKDIAAHDTQSAMEITSAWHAALGLAEVTAARRRLDTGTYGLCLTCGEPIAESRLLAMPAAPFCTACQTLHERSGHH